jgi:hypothetical protein
LSWSDLGLGFQLLSLIGTMISFVTNSQVTNTQNHECYRRLNQHLKCKNEYLKGKNEYFKVKNKEVNAIKAKMNALKNEGEKLKQYYFHA